MSEKTCPLCKKRLSLKQVNFDLAVYICKDLKCSYPVGHDCIVVERKLDKMDMNSEGLDGANEDWIDEIVTNNSGASSDSIEVSCSTNTVLTDKDSVDWIDNLVEEAVNEARLSEASTSSEVTRNSDSAPIVNTDFDEILDFMFTS